MNTLYIVPTPIGNLEDITLRALRILREVSLIAAEDTRTSRVLLNRYEIITPMTSYHEHNKLVKLETIFDALAQGDVALISDAGTPGISDPGYELIVEAIARGVRIEPLPGPNAVLPALVGSGLPSDSFIYLGFLPRKEKARRDLLTSLADETRTMIVYEAPGRLLASLEAIQQVFGDRPVCVARELSKKFEEFQRGSVSEVIAHYEANPPRGEITLVISGKSDDNSPWNEQRVQAALVERLSKGDTLTQAAKAVAAASGWHKREVYALGYDTDADES